MNARFFFAFRRANVVLCLFCLLFSLGCRFYGLSWDEGTQLHPDERFCTSLVPRLSAPTSLSDFFDSRVSPLNPDNIKDQHYIYGQLPLFLGKIAARVTHQNDGPNFLLIARALSALFDCATVWLSFLIARRLFGGQWALFAATLVAGAALHVQQSHFFVVDTFAACFSTASFWAGTRLIQTKKLLNGALSGAFFGAALACKISTALFGVALLGFLVVFARQNPLRKTIFGVLWCVCAAILVFRIGHPMAFRGEFGFFDLRPEPRFWGDLSFQGAITRGEVDVPFDVQWIGRAPWLFSLRNLGFWGYGWPFLLSAAGGIALLAAQRRGHAILVVGAIFGLVLLGIQGAAFSKFTRYFLPLTPFCALLATHFWREMSAKKSFFQFGAAVIVLSATLWTLSVTSIYGRPHTRLEASRWIVENIAPGTVVANETAWDEGLPISWSATGSGDLKALNLDSYANDTPQKRADLEKKLAQTQWIFLSSGRSWQNIPRWNAKWPLMSEFYRALFDGRLGFHLEKRFGSFPQFGPLQFPDASAEEALTVYDHPLILLFHKDQSYRDAKIREVFGAVEFPENQNWQPRLAPAPDENSLPLPPGF